MEQSLTLLSAIHPFRPAPNRFAALTYHPRFFRSRLVMLSGFFESRDMVWTEENGEHHAEGQYSRASVVVA